MRFLCVVGSLQKSKSCYELVKFMMLNCKLGATDTITFQLVQIKVLL